MNTPSQKTCNKCSRSLPIDQFHIAKDRRGGRRHQCKHCCARYNKMWQTKDPQNARTTWRNSSKKRYDTDKRRLKTLTSYGLTEAQYEALKSFSPGCHICHRSFKGRENIDHCHATGNVRGLLCFRCNTAIGSFNDDVEVMKRAIAYVENEGFYGAQATADGQLPLKETMRGAATAPGTTNLTG